MTRDMPTLMQKIRLALRGWNRRREERDREFLAKNAGWGSGAPAPSPAASRPTTQIDIDGLTVAYLDDSGQFQHYLDVETGEVIDTRESLTGDRYRAIPARTAHSEVEDRRVFIASLEPSETRNRLAASIGMAEAFRKALADDRNIERAWYNFKNDRAIAAIGNWLRDLGLS
jgi:hypothetical protein